jgi:hypothetical protein
VSILSVHGKKKVSDIPVSSRDVTYQLSLGGNNLIIPSRESLVSDIQAGDGRSLTFFYSVFYVYVNLSAIRSMTSKTSI